MGKVDDEASQEDEDGEDAILVEQRAQLGTVAGGIEDWLLVIVGEGAGFQRV